MGLGCEFILNAEDKGRRRLLKAVFKSPIFPQEYILVSEKTFFCHAKVYFTFIFVLPNE